MYPCTEKKALPGTVPAPDRCKADQCTPKVNSFFLPAGWAFFLCFFERYESTPHITPSKLLLSVAIVKYRDRAPPTGKGSFRTGAP